MSSPEMEAWAERWAKCVEDDGSVCMNSGETQEKLPVEYNAEKYRALKQSLQERPNPELSRKLDDAWSEYSQGKMSDQEIERVLREIEQELRIEEAPPPSPDEGPSDSLEASSGNEPVIEVADGADVEFNVFEFTAQGIQHLG